MWYKSWYSNKDFLRRVSQDREIECLVKLYLDYGSTFKSNPFFNNYWFRKSINRYFINTNKSNIKFYRRYYYTNNIVGVDHSYLIRNHSGEYFPLRVWVLRYLGWFIISIGWFKPIKSKSPLNKGYSLKSYKNSAIMGFKRKNTNSLLRTKLLLYFFLKNMNSLSRDYVF